MRWSKKARLAAGLLAGAAAMTGCTADTRPAAVPTQQAVQQQTAQPPEASAETSPDAAIDDEQTPQPLALMIDGSETEAGAVMEGDDLLLPLVETGEALGWKAKSEQSEEETQTKHQIALQRNESRITVSWEVSDNTIRRISWQKDGLLVPVDTRIEIIGETVYVPAAFFEEATSVSIVRRDAVVEVSSPEPIETSQTNQ